MGKRKINYSEERREVGEGSARQMHREREKQLPKMEEALEEFLDEWKGQPSAFVSVDGSQQRTIVMGVGRTHEQLGLAQALITSGVKVIKQVIETIDSPKEKRKLQRVLEEMIEEIFEEEIE